MSLGKRLISLGAAPPCLTDSLNVFGAEDSYSSNIAIYRFESNANDETGNYNGTATNVTYSTGNFGNAAVFNGSSSVITVEDSSANAFGFANHIGTVSAWVNINSFSAENNILAKRDTGSPGNRHWMLLVDTSKNVNFFIYNTDANQQTVTSSTVLNADQWYHIAVTLTTSNVIIYINGVKDTTASSTYTTIQNDGADLQIGRRGTNSGYNYFNGKIDQVRIFDKALSASEIATLYNETAASTTDTNLFGDSSSVALYTLDYDASEASGQFDGTPTDVEFGVGGQINYGARFNGSSSYISSSNILDTSSAFSYSVWIKPQTIGLYDYLVGHQQAGSPYAGVGLIGTASNTFSIALAGSAPQVMTPSLTLDSWSHIVLTHDGSGNYTCYTNNNGSPITYSGATSNNASNPFRIGFSSVSGWGYFDGDIDQVRVFNKELNSTEVSTLYAETACVYTCTTDTVDYPTTNVAYYKLDNNSTDETGSYDGTETDISYEFGRFGQAAVFNGSSSRIDTGISSISSPFAVSMWINEDVLDSGIFFGNWNSTTADMYWQTTSDGRLRISIDGFSVEYFGTAGDVKINTWHHIAVTLSGGSYEVYLDGNSLGTSTTSVTTFSSGQNFMIGNSSKPSTPLPFDGKIDQVRIFSSALDSTQVTQLYEEKPCADTSTFKTVLYEGNSSTQYISNVGFQPDFVWVKSRDSSGYYHNLFDSVRGSLKRLISNGTFAEDSNGKLSSFDANGFSLIAGGDANTSGQSMVAWCWKAGGDAVSNTDGSIASQVSANTASGFSIVKYTGNSTAGATIGHGLSAKPEFILIKNLDSALNWIAYDTNINSVGYLDLNDAFATSRLSWGFNNTDPTDTLITLGSNSGVNASSNDYIAYCFHSVSGVSKVGSYEGSGSSQTIYVTDDDSSTGSGGFEPSFVMVKNIDAAANWMMYDARRDADGTINLFLEANTSDIEASAATATISPISNGFTIGNSNSIHLNDSTDTYIYLAFA